MKMTISAYVAALLFAVGCGGSGGSKDVVFEVADSVPETQVLPDAGEVVGDVVWEIDADFVDSFQDLVAADVGTDLVDPVELTADLPDLDDIAEIDSEDTTELPDLAEELDMGVDEVAEADLVEPSGLFSVPESLITDFVDSTTGGSLPVIRIDGDGGLHVAWRQRPKPDPAMEAILYRHRPPGGDWGPMEVVEAHATGAVLSPSGMAVGLDGTVAITWAEDKGVFDEQGNEYCNDVYYKVRSPQGVWSPIYVVVQLAAPAWPECSQSRPDVTIDKNGGFHFVWDDQRHDPPEGEIYIIAADIYYRHTPSGLPEDFGPEVRLTDVTQGSVHPRIHAGPYGAIHVVWTTNHDEAGPDKYWIKYRRKPAWEGEFGPEETVDWFADHGQRAPEVVEDESTRAHIAWLEYKEFLVMNIHYRQRGYESGSFNEEETVVDNVYPKGGVSRGLALAVAPDGTAHIAWHQDNGFMDAPGDFDVYYTSRHSGWWPQTWALPVQINPEGSGDQKDPSLAIGPDGTIHAVWADGSAGLTYESSGNQYPRLDVYYANTNL